MKKRLWWISLVLVLVVFLSLFILFENNNKTNYTIINEQFEKDIEKIQKIINKDPVVALEQLDSLFIRIESNISNYNDSLLGKFFLSKGNANSNINNRSNTLINYHISLYYFNKIGNSRLISKVLTNLGLYYAEQLLFDSAAYYYNHSREIKLEIKDSSGLASLLNNIAFMHIWQGKYTDAINEFYEALEIVKKGYNLDLMSNIYNNIANVYSLLNKYDEAILNYKKSIEIDSIQKNFRSIATTYSNIGILFNKSKQFKEAIRYYTLSNDLAHKNNDRNLIIKNTLNLAYTYVHLKEYENVKKTLDELSPPTDDLELIFNYNQLYSSIYYNLNQYDKSIKFLENSLSLNIQNHSIYHAIDVYKQLSKIYQKKQNFRKAFDYFVQATELQDSLNFRDASNKIQELEVKYKTKEKEKENQILKVEQRRKTQILVLLLIITIAIVIAAIIFFYLYRKNKHLTQLVTEKNTLLEKVNNELFNTLELRTRFISIISHDLKNSIAALKILVY